MVVDQADADRSAERHPRAVTGGAPWRLQRLVGPFAWVVGSRRDRSSAGPHPGPVRRPSPADPRGVRERDDDLDPRPDPGPGANSTAPPWIAARSRMPSIPRPARGRRRRTRCRRRRPRAGVSVDDLCRRSRRVARGCAAPHCRSPPGRSGNTSISTSGSRRPGGSRSGSKQDLDRNARRPREIAQCRPEPDLVDPLGRPQLRRDLAGSARAAAASSRARWTDARSPRCDGRPVIELASAASRVRITAVSVWPTPSWRSRARRARSSSWAVTSRSLACR